MAFPKIADVRAMSDDDIAQGILDAKKQLFDLRFKLATRQEIKSHEFKHTKHRLSQLLMIESERAKAAVQPDTQLDAQPDTQSDAEA